MLRTVAAITTVVALAAFAAPARAGIEEADAAHEAGDYESELRELLPLAEQGDAAAQSRVGYMVSWGIGGGPKDDAEGVRWLLLAVEQGHAEAQANLAVMVRAGRGVAQDIGEAVRLYRLAARQSQARAQAHLAVMYNNGEWVEQDHVRAYALFTLAAMNGDPMAESFLPELARRILGPDALAEARELSRRWMDDPSLID